MNRDYYEAPVTPPLGFTITSRPRTSSKEKREKQNSSNQNKSGLSNETGDDAQTINFPPTVNHTTPIRQMYSFDPNMSRSDSSIELDQDLLDIPSIFPFPVGSVQICQPSKKRSFKDKRRKAFSFKEKGERRRKSMQLARSISFTVKSSMNQNYDDAISYSSILESRRMSVSVPDMIKFEKTSTNIHSVSFDEEDYFRSEEDMESSVHPGEKIPWTWRNIFDFVVYSLCHALGLSNIWRFPYFCYSNGGGSFLLAYLILMIGCSAPLLCMEFSVGKITQNQAILAFRKICPLMKGIGLSGIIICFWLTSCYSVLISWCMFYFFNSLYPLPRWLRCFQSWNTKGCHVKPLTRLISASNGTLTTNGFNLGTTPATIKNVDFVILKPLQPTVVINISTSTDEFFNNKLLEVTEGINHLGELRFELLAAILFAWIFLFVAVRKPTFLVGHTRYILAILPNIVFVVLLVYACSLEGSQKGILYLFKPRWEGLQNIKVWLYALAQTFHSLGIVFGYGISTGANDHHFNSMFKSSAFSMLFNLYSQLMVSSVIFATIGHLSFKWTRPVATALQRDPGVVFMAFSELISTMPMPTFWAIIVFIVFFCLAMDSQVTLLQTMLSALKEVYSDFLKHYFHGHMMFLLFLCCASIFCSIPYVTRAGVYFFQLTDHYVSVLCVCTLAFLEMVVISWIYGAGNFSEAIMEKTGNKPRFFIMFQWYLLAPLTIFGMLVAYAFTGNQVTIREGYVYPVWAYPLGWLLICIILGCIPFCAFSTLRKSSEEGLAKRYKASLKPCPEPKRPEVFYEPQPIIVLKSPGHMVSPTFPFLGGAGLSIMADSDSETRL